MGGMRSPLLKYALAVFLGGASYGAMGTVAKSAFAAGFAWPQTVMSQALFGTLLFGLAFAVEAARNKGAVPMNARRLLKLAGTGMVTATTGVLYSIALSKLPVAVAITLLFQFTWIGIVIQVVATRKPPHAAQVTAAVVIMAGTVLASGLLSSDVDFASFDPVGIACALLSAVSCAAFMYLSGHVENDMPSFQRGFFICLGSLVVGVVVCPGYFPSGVLFQGIAGYGVLLAVTVLFVPVLLFGIGTPKLPVGVSTILAASELPCGILVSIIVLGEGIGAVQAAGVVAILAGVVIAQGPTMRVRPHRRSEGERVQ
ncbi:EamA family transporter [Gordonibacter sp. An230]|nr:EamA family transporter [Gordonibacter sp. An230]